MTAYVDARMADLAHVTMAELYQQYEQVEPFPEHHEAAALFRTDLAHWHALRCDDGSPLSTIPRYRALCFAYQHADARVVLLAPYYARACQLWHWLTARVPQAALADVDDVQRQLLLVNGTRITVAPSRLVDIPLTMEYALPQFLVVDDAGGYTDIRMSAIMAKVRYPYSEDDQVWLVGPPGIDDGGYYTSWCVDDEVRDWWFPPVVCPGITHDGVQPRCTALAPYIDTRDHATVRQQYGVRDYARHILAAL